MVAGARINMKLLRSCLITASLICSLIGSGAWCVTGDLRAQDQKASNGEQEKAAGKSSSSASEPKDAPGYSGMYTFLKEGEFVQLTVEDSGSVTGFVSRFGDGDSDKGAFLDQFFKTGKLEGNKLSFTTEIVHGVAFDFRGSLERGEGKNPGDEGYFVIKGTLTENVTDANKKVSSNSRPVVFKMFPQEAGPAAAARK
jgi:hypothetical protein